MNEGTPIIRYQDIDLEQHYFESTMGKEHLHLSYPRGLLALGSDCADNAVLVQSPGSVRAR